MNASYHSHKGEGGGSFLILQDVMGWATGFFIPFLGEGQQRPSPLKQILPAHPPVLHDQSQIRVVALYRSFTVQ